MKQKTRNQVAYWLKVAVFGIILGLGLQFVRAWTEPPAGTTPPNGNVGAPINTSGNPQTKAGAMNSSTSFSAPIFAATNYVSTPTLYATTIYFNGTPRTFWPGYSQFNCYWINLNDQCISGFYGAGVILGDPLYNSVQKCCAF